MQYIGITWNQTLKRTQGCTYILYVTNHMLYFNFKESYSKSSRNFRLLTKITRRVFKTRSTSLENTYRSSWMLKLVHHASVDMKHDKLRSLKENYMMTVSWWKVQSWLFFSFPHLFQTCFSLNIFEQAVEPNLQLWAVTPKKLNWIYKKPIATDFVASHPGKLKKAGDRHEDFSRKRFQLVPSENVTASQVSIISVISSPKATLTITHSKLKTINIKC